MPDQCRLQTDPHVRILRQYSHKAGSRVDLIQHGDGSVNILRVYDHPVPAYEALLGHTCPALPQILRCCAKDGQFFIEEEFVDGIRLSDLLETCRPDDSQACAIIRQVCCALSVLHGRGFIHRDVKPENILLTSAGRIVLLDLDASTEEDQKKQQDTRLLGTVGYAAPEQFGFGRSNVRTDVFGVGVLLNVLCTGQHPSQRLTAGPLRPVVERCIEVNADKRYPSIEALLDHLPKTIEPVRCSQCGFITPGGGCIHCGKPGKLCRSRKKLTALLAAAAAFAVVIGVCVSLCKPAPVPEQPEASAEPSVVPETPTETKGTEPTDTPLTTEEAPAFDLPGRPLTEEDIGEWCTPQMTDTLAPFFNAFIPC